MEGTFMRKSGVSQSRATGSEILRIWSHTVVKTAAPASGVRRAVSANAAAKGQIPSCSREGVAAGAGIILRGHRPCAAIHSAGTNGQV